MSQSGSYARQCSGARSVSAIAAATGKLPLPVYLRSRRPANGSSATYWAIWQTQSAATAAKLPQLHCSLCSPNHLNCYETYILCRTAGRKEKEQAIRKRFSSSMEKALKALEKSILLGRLKDRHKMERRLGKIQARHPSVNDLYTVSLRDTSEGVRLSWQIKEGHQKWRESREGAYLLRTIYRRHRPRSCGRSICS